ncbi:MAG: hypothetical protein V3V00_13930 [Saprospiraceae bacterium]
MTALLFFTILAILGGLITYKTGQRDMWLMLGLSFPLGFGYITIVSFIFDLLHVPITIISGTVAILIGIAGLIFNQKDDIVNHNFNPQACLKSVVHFFKNYWGSLFIIGIIAYLLLGISTKAILWPTAAYDSIEGFDFVAKVISQEHVLRNSLFDISYPLASVRAPYPPLVPINFAYAYMAGMEYPKIISVLFIISTFFIMFGLAKDISKNLFIGLILAFILMSTPEYLAMSALSLTNVPTALYAGFGLIFIYRFVNTSKRTDFYLGLILLTLGMWTRTEVIIFSIVAILILGLWSYKNKKYKETIVLTGLIFGSYIIWKLYVDLVLQAQMQQSLNFLPFYDGQKISDILNLVKFVTFSTQYYGWVVYLFLGFGVTLLLPKNRMANVNLYIIIIITWILYVILYYQMDNVDANGNLIPNYITAGYRRGFFSFLPLITYFIASSAPIILTSEWINKKL